MTSLLTIDPSVQDLAVGLVQANGISIAPPENAQVQQCRDAIDALWPAGPEGGDERRHAVRRLLRHGGFKPSGRNKPAQEYLLRAASPDGQWPTILNVVDVLNVISLRSGLPISLIAVNRLQTPFVIRYGLADESFEFNSVGQELKLSGLICVCQSLDGETQPVGTPVKDSQLAKVTCDDDHVLACIFAPQASVPASRLRYWTDELAAGFAKWCTCAHLDTGLYPPQW